MTEQPRMCKRLFFGVLAIALAAAPAAAQDWARNLFETTTHDFGSVARGAKAEYSFVLTNNLAADIHIADVRSSCGCTTPRIETPLLKTYEKGAIVAHLNSDRFLGRRGATLTVTIDSPAYAEVQLQIKAYVHEDVLLDPTSIELGAVDHGKSAAGKMIVYRYGAPNWQIQQVKFANPFLSGEVAEVGRQNNQVWYELRVRLSDKAPPGYLSDHVVLVTNDQQVAELPIAVGAQVQPKVILSPASLFFGILRPGDKATKQLVVRSKQPFRITAVEAEAASFQVPSPGSEAKTLHLVPITFVAGAQWGKVVKTIRIRTDQPEGTVEASTFAVVEQPAP